MSKTTRIKRVQIPENARLMMISDIHGHASGLRALLKQTDFNKRDVLVIVGDLLEKGDENLQLVRDVMKLCEEYNVYVLTGNVDVSRLNMLMTDDPSFQQRLLKASMKNKQWWPSSILEEMCTEIGVKMDEQMDTQSVYPRLRQHFKKELDFIANLPVILETQRFIFVHGGIPHERLDELECTDGTAYLKRDAFWQEGLSFDKYVVVGHWPAALYADDKTCHNPIIDQERHIICLDGACGLKKDGQLNLVCLQDWRSDDFQLYTWDDFPEITALEDQEESGQSYYIHWARQLPEVTVVEERGEITRVRYMEHELDVPTSYLWMENGQWHCDDITSYQLPVKAGEKLRLVETNAIGCYVKKDGVVGWYKGKFQ